MVNVGQVSTGTKKVDFTEGTEKLSVDGANHRIASLSTLNTDGYTYNLLILQLYDKGVMYIVRNGQCQSSELQQWNPICVPDSATIVKQTYYGMDKNKVDVDIYALQAGPDTVYLTMARTDCVPVYQATFGSPEGVSGFLSTKAYRNISTGIKNPSVFDIPSICTNATKYPKMLVPKYGLY
ncbi:ependymin-related protein 1-like [Mercenaria mercenaria]|uniref:ependymin-related protein 1-like n=1 Tax=Mercenaria mercenaria TaxID=6596 RepID=UPI00234EF3CE|nr:ependymin-related protein 1-like [Mercenaria mercenaria]